MKHFVEARTDSLAVLRGPELAALVQKACLMVDLQGRIRAVIRPADSRSADTAGQAVRQALAGAADVFWAGEIWVEHPDEHLPSRKALFDAVWRQARAEPAGQDRVFILDRHLSKDAWLDAPFDPPWPLDEHAPPIVSFYSFKGGVGRTTALLALAVNVARAGKRAVIIDFDLEAPGAGSLACAQAGPGAGLGVIDYVLEHPIAPRGKLDVGEFYHACDDPAVIGDGEPLYVVPAGKLDRWYLEKLARVNYEYLYRTASERGGAQSPLHGLLKMLRAKLEPFVVLIDSRAGFHDLGGLSLSGIAHLQVLFGLDSQQSWDGLALAVSHLGEQMVLDGNVQRDCAMVHAHAPPAGPVRTTQIRQFRERSFEIFSDHYYDAPDAPDAQWPLPDPEDHEAPHYPTVLTWDQRIAGYNSLGDIARFLCESEYRSLCEFLLEKLGRAL